MRHEANVISLTSVIDRRAALLMPSLPMLLLRIRDSAAQHVSNGLQALFDMTEEVLIEQVDKAHDVVEQRRSLQAMRDVRLKRKHVEHGVLDALHQAFSSLTQSASGALLDADLSRHARANAAQHALIQAMVERVLSREGAVLAQLSARIEAMLDIALTGARCNPLSPSSLCQYFAQACSMLKVDEPTMTVLFGLFEQHVLGRIGPCYVQANRLLASEGVLPGLSPAPSMALAPRAGVVSIAAGHVRTGTLQAAAEAFFERLQALLAPLRGQLTPRLRRDGAVPVSAQDLARMLSHLQHHAGEGGAARPLDLGQALQHLLLKISARSCTRRCLSGDDEDTINLMGRLFAVVEQDPNLHPRMRALLARLHLPLLKVAILDKSLLTRASHPARRLVNELGAAAIGWQGDHDTTPDSLYLRLEGGVQRVLDDVAEDHVAFKSHLDAFLAASLEERRRHDLLEQRARDAEEGHARMQQARSRVEDVLNQRVLGQRLPRVVLAMLRDAWSQVLVMAWLKQGEQSALWQSALATLDALLASVAPHPQAQARQRLLARLPALLKALREGLGSIALSSLSTREFFRDLERLHVRACALPGQPMAPSAGALRCVRVNQPIRLPGAEPAPAQAALDSAIPRSVLKVLERLRIGTWVEVREGDRVLRCRLLARIEGRDRYVFANHAGVKLREWTRAELADAIKRNAVAVLNGGRVFERALRTALEQLAARELH
ncbi:DUF1631 family protein [Pseudomonas sp. RP23018S]|uniref:DUF1631 family protein n=1 Tax=Pseudomonas sp. RP23018S TaxID=3096037 RepID=UPI002ACAEE2A|nr:DUF1631 family protein [Pseudomonas sp. RP23018S]MDZ5604817.1 DUF1631 family protein [Pseudomonas sp. RP23018S]